MEAVRATLFLCCDFQAISWLFADQYASCPAVLWYGLELILEDWYCQRKWLYSRFMHLHKNSLYVHLACWCIAFIFLVESNIYACAGCVHFLNCVCVPRCLFMCVVFPGTFISRMQMSWRRQAQGAVLQIAAFPCYDLKSSLKLDH